MDAFFVALATYKVRSKLCLKPSEGLVPDISKSAPKLVVGRVGSDIPNILFTAPNILVANPVTAVDVDNAMSTTSSTEVDKGLEF
jgi:hypothetical protein